MAPLVHQLYRQACHGAGAEPRWAARDELDELAKAQGVTTAQLLTAEGFDLGPFFASRPISRPVAEPPG